MENLIIKSNVDQSVNFIYPSNNIGKFEARYVRREDQYFIIYVSSQSGCDQARSEERRVGKECSG